MASEFSVLAERLRRAYNCGPVEPLRDGLGAQDAEGAYAIQRLNARHWIGEGRVMVGRKIGLTALAVQKQLGVDQPDFGVLFSDMQIADGGTLHAESVLQPKAEAEIALVMGRDLSDPRASVDEVLAAVDCAMAAIEIVDSRIADWKITYADTVADNGSSAFFVLGPPRRPVAELDLRTCGMILEVNGEVVSLGAGAACLGHPLIAAAWLARMLASMGEGLRAGDIILTGALGPMVPLSPGDAVQATVGGIGSCGFRYQAASR